MVESHTPPTRVVMFSPFPCLSSNQLHLRQVAFWNLVGAIGFTLCGALGYAATSSSRVSSTLSDEGTPRSTQATGQLSEYPSDVLGKLGVHDR